MAMKRVVTCCHDNQSFKLMGKHSTSTSSLFITDPTSSMGEFHVSASRNQRAWEKQGRDKGRWGLKEKFKTPQPK